LNRDQKAAVVEELAEEIRDAEAIFAVDYRGISVPDAAELRARLRGADTRFRIVKNSLTERASDKAGAESLKELLEGPTALAFVAGDAALAAKALNDMARTLGTLAFKGGLMDGAAITADEIRVLARLPAREVLHAQLVGTIASPLSGLVRTLNALVSGLALQLGQIAEQGLVTGEAPPTSEAGRASDGDGDADTSGATASDADDSSPEPEAEAPEPEATADSDDASGSEGGAEHAPETEDASASEALAPEAEADQSDSEAHGASETDASTDQQTEASDGEAEKPKEEA
jgi:large subunit ribosomal protein L10